MTTEEIREKRAKLEAEKKEMEGSVTSWENCKRSSVAETERRYDAEIEPLASRISAIVKELSELQEVCSNKSEHGRGQPPAPCSQHDPSYFCSLCGAQLFAYRDTTEY